MLFSICFLRELLVAAANSHLSHHSSDGYVLTISVIFPTSRSSGTRPSWIDSLTRLVNSLIPFSLDACSIVCMCYSCTKLTLVTEISHCFMFAFAVFLKGIFRGCRKLTFITGIFHSCVIILNVFCKESCFCCKILAFITSISTFFHFPLPSP